MKKITVIGERVLLARYIGWTIAAGLREVEIRNEVLRVGKRFPVRLDGMVNKEQVKDLLLRVVESRQVLKEARHV